MNNTQQISLATKSNGYVRYYTPEGPNSAFNQVSNGAFRRGIEEEASIISAQRILESYGEKEFESWSNNHSEKPEMEKRAKIEFIKECERMALLPEKELHMLANYSSERLQNNPSAKPRNNQYKLEIMERAGLYER